MTTDQETIQPVNNNEDFLLKLQSISENELRTFIQKARNLGISEAQIQEGINFIQNLRGNAYVRRNNVTS